MPETRSAEFYIEYLKMLNHPEGGWFKETYRSGITISQEELPENFKGVRNCSTAIYFLLTKESFSAFHRIKSDEMWHFYDGDGLVIHELKQDGSYIKHHLGLRLHEGEEPQVVIGANSWFASEVVTGGDWCLVGCTVSPGFDFEDFEMATEEGLVSEYPEHRQLIERLT
ncbi:MAG: cupin domain-containing protein [Flavobacteriales bacterium]|jgi:hypothetical protein|nr:cupin domain-containing protein [Flavobacteriales bacterium]